jgi:spermidine/putrescine transport system permease protein
LTRGTVTGLNARNLLFLPTVLWVGIFFLAPLALVAVYSFGTADLITFDIKFGWTVDNYQRVTDSLYLRTIMRSLFLSSVATIVCLLISLPLAFFISRQRRKVQIFLLFAVLVPFATSFIIRTYAWTNILQNEGPVQDILQGVGLLEGSLNILYTPTSVGIGIVYAYLPLMILPIYVALERLDPRLIDAANDLGCHGWRLQRRVIAPLAAPGILAGCLLVGIPATGEFIVPSVLGGGKILMLGNVVGNQFLGVGDIPFGSSIAMSLMALLMIIVLITRRAYRGTIEIS